MSETNFTVSKSDIQRARPGNSTSKKAKKKKENQYYHVNI